MTDQDVAPNPLIACLLDLIENGSQIRLLRGTTSIDITAPDLAGADLKHACRFVRAEVQKVAE